MNESQFYRLFRTNPEALVEMIKALKRIEKENRIPETGEEVFFVGLDNCEKSMHWQGLREQYAILKAGNLYKTREEARSAAITVRLRKKYRSLGRAFDKKKANWRACYSPERDEISYIADPVASEGTYFDSSEECSAAIEAIGGEEIFFAYILENDEHKRL